MNIPVERLQCKNIGINSNGDLNIKTNRIKSLEIEKENKKHRLEVKLMNRDELLVIEGSDNINMPDIIEQYFNQEKDFICFGYIGVRRSEIEWYAIIEVVEENE